MACLLRKLLPCHQHCSALHLTCNSRTAAAPDSVCSSVQTDEQAEEEHNADKVDEDEGGLDRDAQAAEKQAAKEPEDKQGKGQGKLTDKEGRASGASALCACTEQPLLTLHRDCL